MQIGKIKTGIVFTLLSFLASFFNYLFNFIVARKFSLAIYGEYSATIAIFLFFTVIFNTINTIVVKKISQQKKQNRWPVVVNLELAFIELLKSNLWLVIILCLIGYLFFIKVNQLTNLSAISLVTYVWLMVIFNYYLALFQGLKKFYLHGKLNIALSVIRIIFLFILGFIISDLLGIYITLICSTLLIVLVAKSSLIKQKIKERQPVINISLIELIKRANFYQPLLINFGLMALLVIDVIMAKRFFTPDEVGLYSSFSLLGRLIFYFFYPLIQVAYTGFAEDVLNKNQFKKLFQYGLLISGISIPLVFIYYLMPELVINLIVGQKFFLLSSSLFLSSIFGVLYSLLQLQVHFWLAHQKNSILALPLFFLLSLFLMQVWHNSFINLMLINILTVSLANLWLLIKNLNTYLKN